MYTRNNPFMPVPTRRDRDTESWGRATDPTAWAALDNITRKTPLR